VGCILAPLCGCAKPITDQFDFLEERPRNAVTDITIAKRLVSKWDPQNASSDRDSSVESSVRSSDRDSSAE